MLPAVELAPSKKMKLPLPPELARTKFWVIPELFVTPVPLALMVNANGASTVIMNALAPELNVIPATVVLAEIETPVVLEVAKVAVSLAPLGNPVFGVQFVLVSQSPVPGLRSQVALPALAEPAATRRMMAAARRMARSRMDRAAKVVAEERSPTSIEGRC